MKKLSILLLIAFIQMSLIAQEKEAAVTNDIPDPETFESTQTVNI